MKKIVIVGIIILSIVFIAFAVKKISPPEDNNMPPGVNPGPVKVQEDKEPESKYSDSLETKISPETRTKFEQIMDKAKKDNWKKLPIGELMGKIGLELRGIPYASATLYTPGQEVCVVDLTGLDCVTFFENVLNMARLIKMGSYDMDKMAQLTEETRYHGGKLQGYVSRLHYTADWIHDNVERGIVKDITKDIGGKIIKFDVGYMSQHPDKYSGLKGNQEAINKMKEYEKDINQRTYYYIPKNEVKQAEKYLETGDIIAITTNLKGLDYSHTGMIYKDKDGTARFLQASLTKHKVILDGPLHKYLAGVKKHTGITVLRPVSPDA